jgi:sulfofructose kinase
MAGVAVDSSEPCAVDVLGLGVTAVDEILYVDAYPPADTKLQVRRRERNLGGLTSIALIAAARLGCRTAYAGVLGNDEASEFVISNLKQEGIDLRYLVRHDDARPIRATIIVGSNPSTRNIFFELNDFTGAHPRQPDAAVIRAARVLLVDHVGIEGMLRAARIAREAGIPIVSDLELAVSSSFHDLLTLVDHPIMSCNFAAQLTGETVPAAMVEKLWTPMRKVVVVTCGAEGAWYLTEDGRVRHQPAFKVNAVDTTGCGDVFHGVYAACLARGLDVAERIRFASAAAALKATQSGGARSVPVLSAVEAFLQKNA